jgi:hypothetical protein
MADEASDTVGGAMRIFLGTAGFVSFLIGAEILREGGPAWVGASLIAAATSSGFQLRGNRAHTAGWRLVPPRSRIIASNSRTTKFILDDQQTSASGQSRRFRFARSTAGVPSTADADRS